MALPQAALAVRDLPEAVRFYCEGLGFALRSRAPGTATVQSPGGTLLLLAAPAADLSQWPGLRRPAPTAWVYVQHADLPALAATLEARGIRGEGPEAPYPGFRRLRVADPNHFVIVFWETLPLTDPSIIAIYRSGPERLQQALAGLVPADLERRWAPGKRTVRELVHHLVEADLGALHILHMALAEPGRQLHGDFWDDDAVVTTLNYADRPVQPAAALFSAARAWVLDTLAHLPDGLDRSVLWPSGYRADARSLLRHAGGHALHHIGQIAQAVQP